MPVLVTGSAGFIGNALAFRLLGQGNRVIGVDCYTPYYDVGLKEARTRRLEAFPSFCEERIDLADSGAVLDVFKRHRPRLVLHMAAQAGVRYSIENPKAYMDSNLAGTFSVLEACRAVRVAHLVYASTSSVYGANTTQPFSEHHPADHPLTFYAATKRSGELMAHSYAHLFRLPVTALRFFTVYGPWGRPDMALFSFTAAILENRPIPVFNKGQMVRDFTYIDDIVDGVLRATACPPEPDMAARGIPDPATSPAGPFRIFNIGASQPVELLRYIRVLEQALGKAAIMDLQPMQAGDVPSTWADTSELAAATGYAPSVCVETGVRRFVDWYRTFYNV
ncbi:NAD-dependent epimerase/dehydratase family protein [Phaeovibrio sulfidiphilus]|uniref:NAD-dependent epimerase/dehydratase family protein n=1 Tax=Phaeovibrio sulfidiphilus TaxID=1220600 RepID=A0A8J6YM19_9PROT|nr:NAD-dependent epimerase/dehydratase family protein [Phaeovibrio sulfidiphilus]MBE1236905.1 NAD-dependent epimerase/dehydratase family protein [Phaeovibrio sulfidiphilus]